MFGVGIWTVADKSYIEVLLRNELYMTMAYVLIVAGLLVVFVSFVGCLGAVKEVRRDVKREGDDDGSNTRSLWYHRMKPEMHI